MVDIDVEKLNSIAIPRDQIADSIKTDIPFMINNIMHIYDDYLNAYQMYNNIDVVQKELKNLKLD